MVLVDGGGEHHGRIRGPRARDRRTLRREPVRLLQPHGVEARRQLASQLLGGVPPLVGEPLLGQLGFLTHHDGAG